MKLRILLMTTPLLWAAQGIAAGKQPMTDLSLEARSMALLEQHFLADAPEGTALERLSATRDERGIFHTRVRQTYLGFPIFEGEAIVHLDSTGRLMSITDNLFTDLEFNAVPTLTPGEAIAAAQSLLPRSPVAPVPARAELLGARAHDGDHLAYRVDLLMDDDPVNPSMPVIFIDAHTGARIGGWDNLQSANVTGTGASHYYGNVLVEAWLNPSNGTYYLQDVDYRRIGTFDGTGDTSNSTSTCKPLTDNDNYWDATLAKAGVNVAMGTQSTLDYYKNVRGRNGIDGAGGPAYCKSADGVTKLVTSRVHFGTKYNNAFWNGTFMTYGDGDGTNFSPLVSVDVIAHEITHGVTQYTAGLTYSGESGALNESMSDVFGTLVEFYTFGGNGDWMIGEDCYTPATAGDALRHMDDPHKATNKGYTANDDPDHYSERYTGTGDNGGVHINSGISNKAFYLLVNGGTHHLSGTTVTGLGTSKSGKIWFKSLASYMTSCTNFTGARKATLDATTALYGAGTTEYKTVAKVWDACGVADAAKICSTLADSDSSIQYLNH